MGETDPGTVSLGGSREDELSTSHCVSSGSTEPCLQYLCVCVCECVRICACDSIMCRVSVCASVAPCLRVSVRGRENEVDTH